MWPVKRRSEGMSELWNKSTEFEKSTGGRVLGVDPIEPFQFELVISKLSLQTILESSCLHAKLNGWLVQHNNAYTLIDSP